VLIKDGGNCQNRSHLKDTVSTKFYAYTLALSHVCSLLPNGVNNPAPLLFNVLSEALQLTCQQHQRLEKKKTKSAEKNKSAQLSRGRKKEENSNVFSRITWDGKRRKDQLRHAKTVRCLAFFGRLGYGNAHAPTYAQTLEILS